MKRLRESIDRRAIGLPPHADTDAGRRGGRRGGRPGLAPWPNRWRGLTQTELAAQLGVHPNTVSKWESDQQQIRGAAARLLTMLADTRARRRRP